MFSARPLKSSFSMASFRLMAWPASAGGAATGALAGTSLLHHFELHPRSATSAGVDALDCLADDPFQSARARQLEQLLSVLDLVVGIAKRVARIEQSLEELLALDQRDFAQVVTVGIEQVEEVIN